LIRVQEPGTEFFIVGSSPTAQVKRLARQAGVRVTGFVEDVRPYLRSAMVCVVPLRIARGVQNKLLEAMAAGKAVIATPEAVAGLWIRPGEDLLTAGTPSEFAAATLEVIRDEGLRENLGWRARRFVETEHNWKPLLERLVGLIESMEQRPTDSESLKARAIARY
jgi:glycosyltransferase involved in cell wall biosynthesis